MEPLYLNLDGSVLLHSLRLWHVALDVYISYIYIKFIDCYVYIVIGGVNCGVLTLVSEIRRYRSDLIIIIVMSVVAFIWVFANAVSEGSPECF